MAAQYNFTKTITKPPAFEAYMIDNFALFDSFTLDGDNLVVFTTQELTQEEQDTLTTLVNDYTDPEVFLQLATTQQIAARCAYVNSNTAQQVQTLIFTNRNSDDYALDAVKTILEFTADDVTLFAGETTGEVTFTIHDITRDTQMASQTINIDDIIQSWAGMESGSNTVMRSAMFNDLRNKPPNYDVIWQFRLAVSNTNFKVRMHGLQYLFYHVY